MKKNRPLKWATIRTAIVPFSLALIAGCGMAFLSAPSCTAQDLAWKLAVGDRFDVALNQHKNSQTVVDKRQVKIENQTSLGQVWEVEAVDDQGNFKIRQTIKSILIKVGNPEFPSQALSVDTSSETKPTKESGKVLKQIQPLIGLEIFITMSPRGEIKAVTYSDETEEILQALPGSLDLQSLFTDRGVKDLLGAAALVFPAQSPEVGESWQVTDSISNSFGEFRRVRSYRLARMENRTAPQTAVIELTTSIEPRKLGDPKQGKLNSFEETGELYVDLDRGFVTSSKTQSLTDAETFYMEIGVKTQIESTNVVTLKEVRD